MEHLDYITGTICGSNGLILYSLKQDPQRDICTLELCPLFSKEEIFIDLIINSQCSTISANISALIKQMPPPLEQT